MRRSAAKGTSAAIASRSLCWERAAIPGERQSGQDGPRAGRKQERPSLRRPRDAGQHFAIQREVVFACAQLHGRHPLPCVPPPRRKETHKPLLVEEERGDHSISRRPCHQAPRGRAAQSPGKMVLHDERKVTVCHQVGEGAEREKVRAHTGGPGKSG